MHTIVGLGNPGTKYEHNRHNAGYMFIDYINKQMKNEKLKMKKTNVFMNLSGKAVKKIIENFKLKIENLVVIHDDLDIPLGKFKIQKGTGPRLHNGIESIENHLHTKDFLRVRIGIDNRPTPESGEFRLDGETYVLQDFMKEEKLLLHNDVFPKILSRLSPLTKPTLTSEVRVERRE